MKLNAKFWKQPLEFVLFAAAFLWLIPPVPSVGEGHGYDDFSILGLLLPLALYAASLYLHYIKLKEHVFIILAKLLFFCGFAFVIHMRVWMF